MDNANSSFIFPSLPNIPQNDIIGFQTTHIGKEDGTITELLIDPFAFIADIINIANNHYAPITNSLHYAPIPPFGESYLTQGDASSIYLTQANASSNYINLSVFNTSISNLTNQINALKNQIACILANSYDTSSCVI